MKYKFKTNVMCGSCIAKLTPHLDANNEIKQWEVNTENPAKILTVETELSPEQVKEIVNKAGYTAEKINS